MTAVGVGAWDVGVVEGRLARLVPGDGRPFTMGAQLCGRVRAVGAGADGFSVGDRVMANPGLVGAWADRVRLPGSACGRAPARADDAEAATLPVRGLAASQGLALLDLPPESTLLVLGAGGSVGRAVVEVAAARALRVLAIAGADGLASLRELGAERAVDHREDWGTGLASAVGPGVDGVLDLVGGRSLERAFDLVRDEGRIVTSVAPGSSVEPPRGISFALLKMKSVPGDLDALADRVDAGGLTTRISERHGLEDVLVALDAIRRGRREVVLLT